MTDRGVSDSDMPNFSWRARGDASAIPDAALSALLAGRTLPANASPPLQHVADVLAALRAAPASDEAAGKGAALAQFRQRVGVSSQPIRSRRRRPALLSLLRARVAASAAVAVVGLGGFATAAFAGALPSSAQQFAHDMIGAPDPHASHSPKADHTGTPVGPNASGPAAFGLCNAYEHATQHGDAAEKAVAFRNLVRAAGGAANVSSFCKSVAHPGDSSTPRVDTTLRPTDRPTSHPTGKPTSHATGKPAHSG